MLAAQLASMLVERRPFDDLWLQRIVCLWYQLPGERLDDRGRIDAVREEIIERCSDLQ